MKKIRVYNLLSRIDGTKHFNFNLIPFVSFFWGVDYTYLNIGWFNLCLQIKLK